MTETPPASDPVPAPGGAPTADGAPVTGVAAGSGGAPGQGEWTRQASTFDWDTWTAEEAAGTAAPQPSYQPPPAYAP
ncbi:MAG TPA: hypothetical protein VHO01_10945, partial [Jatrophihabitans sp.]|nr:hypothetical protein [Jatrophihabitans sp.]